MQSKYTKLQVKVQEACDYSLANPHLNKSQIARNFGVSYSQLYRRIHGTPSKCDRAATNRKLTNDEEVLLCHVLDRWNHCGLPTSTDVIRRIANDILARRENETVGRDWVRRFLGRHPKCRAYNVQTIAAGRTRSHTNIEHYFRKLHSCLEEASKQGQSRTKDQCLKTEDETDMEDWLALVDAVTVDIGSSTEPS